jgi:hypothetical protein
MKTLFIEKNFKYDGSQLHSLFAYLDFKLMGDSIVAWRGACDIPFMHMVDGEDLLDQSAIRGSDMLHFIIEIFDRGLREAVFTQRLFAAQVMDVLKSYKPELQIVRQGDDLYWNDKKLSISIATVSPVSAMIHFGLNIANAGTPVPTCALSDWGIEPQKFAQDCIKKFSSEYDSIIQATQKVKPVS